MSIEDCEEEYEKYTDFIDHIVTNKLTQKDIDFYKENKEELDRINDLAEILFKPLIDKYIKGDE